jgi:hypothetical protein
MPVRSGDACTVSLRSGSTQARLPQSCTRPAIGAHEQSPWTAEDFLLGWHYCIAGHRGNGQPEAIFGFLGVLPRRFFARIRSRVCARKCNAPFGRESSATNRSASAPRPARYGSARETSVRQGQRRMARVTPRRDATLPNNPPASFRRGTCGTAPRAADPPGVPRAT